MLLRSYEVFDMKGLSLRNALSPVVFRFTAEQLRVVGRVYSGQAHRPRLTPLHPGTAPKVPPLPIPTHPPPPATPGAARRRDQR